MRKSLHNLVEQKVVVRILVVEDDAILRGLLLDVLTGSGLFEADGIGTVAGAEAMLARAGDRVDAILLDASLPDGDGTALCRKLRGAGFDRPIIILTGESGSLAVQHSAASGASEHLIKPVSMAHLVGRLAALTMRSSSAPVDAPGCDFSATFSGSVNSREGFPLQGKTFVSNCAW
jgi:DNA-binding response OmpR family regulator